MVDIYKTKIDDLTLWFPPCYNCIEYPVDIEYTVDSVNNYISDELGYLNYFVDFLIQFYPNDLHSHYDSSYIRANAGEINPLISLWEYVYTVIVIDDIYDSTKVYESEYSDLISKTLETNKNIDSAFDVIEDTVRLDKEYEYDEHKQWYEEDFIYRRNLCKRAVAALNDIFNYIDGVNETISNIVDEEEKYAEKETE